MKPKIKNKNTNKKWFIITLFFVLTQVIQANIALSASITVEEIINLTNKSRAEAGLNLLLVNEKLTKAARKKADDMFELQYFDHNSPNGLTPWDFIKSTGYDYMFAGENLAIDFISAKSAHKALMESASHRENILNSNYVDIGVAVKEDIFEGRKSIIIVEEFGAPLEKEENINYNLNKSIEFVLDEKVSKINNLKDNGEEKEKLEEFLQTGSTQEYKSNEDCSTQEHGDNEREDHRSNCKEKEIDNEQNDNLLFIAQSWYPMRTEEMKNNKRYFSLESISKTKSMRNCSAELKIIPLYYQVLFTEINEKVMGLVNEANAKDEHIKKYNYHQGSVELTMNCHLQNEFILRVFLLYTIIAFLLVFDFMIIVYFSTVVRSSRL